MLGMDATRLISVNPRSTDRCTREQSVKAYLTEIGVTIVCGGSTSGSARNLIPTDRTRNFMQGFGHLYLDLLMWEDNWIDTVNADNCQSASDGSERNTISFLSEGLKSEMAPSRGF